MSLIGEADYPDLEALWDHIEPAVVKSPSLVLAAQHVVDALYERFAESIVLARVFASVEMRHLPPAERAFVEAFSQASGVGDQLNEATPVLSLLGTRGVEADWNDPAKSRGHLAIPLLSEGFVGEIPMIANLLREIGFTPAWKGPTSGLVTKTLANVNGVFYAADARTAIDERGRSIIPATGFVERYGIQTVFGVGGAYLNRHAFVTAIVFCREHIMRTQAMKFVPLIGSLKAATTRLVAHGAFFAE